MWGWWFVTIEEVFGFRPFAEPLLAHAFTEQDLRATVDELGEDVYVPRAPLLAATKFSSLIDRGEGDKAVKDLCDLYALVNYGDADRGEIRSTLHWLLDDPQHNVREAQNHTNLDDALDHLGVAEADYDAAIGPLAAPP
jgi:predicted nucleotidyltransferase